MLAGLAAVGIWKQLSHRKRAREAFGDRQWLAPREQLEGEGLSGEALDAAVREWEGFARSYGYQAGKLRVDDRVQDLTKIDDFGDRGLAFEAKLGGRGIKALPSDLSLADLVRLLSTI